jgi:hypothetical protein
MNHTEQEFKSLRQQIMGRVRSQYKWSSEEFHDIMDQWGYGRSLRALTWIQLQSLKRDLANIKGSSGNSLFDKHGMKLNSYGLKIPEND